MQRKVVKLLATLGVAAAVFVSSASSAEAAFKIRLSSDGDVVTITDQDALSGDNSAIEGRINFEESVGTFTIVGGISNSDPVTGPPGPYLNITADATGTGSLTLEITDTYDNLAAFLSSSINGTALFGDLAYSAYWGVSEFDYTNQIGSNLNFSGSGAINYGGTVFGSGPGGSGSLTILVQITNATAGGVTQFDANIAAPEPATMGLFGLALFGLGGAVRRRFTN